MISKQGVVYGYDNILNLYKKYWNKDNMGTLTFKDIKMQRISNSHFFVTGHFDVALDEENYHQGYFSIIMKKVDEEWRIYSDHS